MADTQRLVEARRLLSELGVTVAELQTAETVTVGMPTIAEYLPQVVAAAGPGARRTYGNYWARMAALWGERRLDEIAATDIEALQREAVAKAVSRRNGRGGRHAGEHAIAAARAFFVRAIADGLIATSASPAHQIAKPRRLPSARRALTPRELAEINDVARNSGNDAILDALLLRLHTETACRRGGALALRRMDLERRAYAAATAPTYHPMVHGFPPLAAFRPQDSGASTSRAVTATSRRPSPDSRTEPAPPPRTSSSRTGPRRTPAPGRRL
jgi:hypothetical protein